MRTIRHATFALAAAAFLATAVPGVRAAGGSGPGSILRSMASLDRAFVPALLATSRGGGARAAAAVIRLQDAWARFDREWLGAGDGDPRWDRDLAAVGRDIDDSARFLRAARPREAAASLEAGRARMERLRHRHHLDYFLDTLAACRSSVETIARLGDELRARSVTGDDLAVLGGRLLPAAQHGLRRLQEATLDNAVFRLGPQRLDLVAPLVEQEGRLLDRLRAAVEKGDGDEVPALARALRGPCGRLFALFGDESLAER